MKLTKPQVEVLRRAAERTDGVVSDYGMHPSTRDALRDAGYIVRVLCVQEPHKRIDLQRDALRALNDAHEAAQDHTQAAAYNAERACGFAINSLRALQSMQWVITQAGRAAIQS